MRTRQAHSRLPVMEEDSLTPAEIRQRCREGNITTPTCTFAPGYAQANLVILPRRLAADFQQFCELNPKPCPVLEILSDGPLTSKVADKADIRTDLPKYRVYRHGNLVEEVTDIKYLWRNNEMDGRDNSQVEADDLVGFLIGCSFSFDSALADAGLEARHRREGKNVPMYETNIQLQQVGPFRGNFVVSMRPYPAEKVDEVTHITEKFPRMHGGPIHVGNPLDIGIIDLEKPLYGDTVELQVEDIPMFWACGASPQNAVRDPSIELCITHAPGHMLVCDISNSALIG